MTDPLWQLSACDIAEGIRHKAFSCEAVMASVTERIAERNGALNAIVYDHSEVAMDQARAADRVFASGAEPGPLYGVPITIKSNIDVEGEPTPNGLPALKDAIAPSDSPVVRNLKNAGAIIVGRTNTPELSMRITTDNPLNGRTFNPWHKDACPGGSSGGASSAAAAGFGPIHHGSDIGGSLRMPSSFCGLATVKPSFGRIASFVGSAMPPERGLLIQLMSVQGAICREVRDVRLATRVMAQRDPRDPFWVPVPFDGWPDPGTLKVALTRESYGYPIHPDLVAGLDRAAGYLSDAGYQVEEVTTPSIEAAAGGWFDLLGSEIETFMMPMAREHGSATIQQILEWYFQMGQVADAEQYRVGIKERSSMTREWELFLDQYPLVLTPYFMRPTPAWDCDAQSFEETYDVFRAAMYSMGINFLSLPAGVVPIGLVEELPAGIQVVGRRYREDLILDAIEAIEARVGVLTRELWAREG